MRLGTILVCAVLFAVLSPAQEFRATILGQVQDATGAVIPEATVVVRNTVTNATFTTSANSQGNYVTAFLLPGMYSVSVEATGFRTFLRENIELRVQDRVTVDAVLEVGLATETVTVSDSVHQIETNTASLGTVIGNRQIESFPLNGRTSYLLAWLAPGVLPTFANRFSRPYDLSGAGQYSLGGNRAFTNEVLADGITNVTGAQFVGFVPPVDATQEFKLQTNTYDSEFGRAAGGTLNVTTKSGTNELHGSLYEFLRNEKLDANGFFNNRLGRPRPHLRWNQFGASIGGPIRLPSVYDGRNKTFFFFSYEGIRQSAATSGTNTVPTLLHREGDFSQTFNSAGQLIEIYDPATTRPAQGSAGFVRDRFANNRIPIATWDPVAAATSRFYPLPNVQGNVSTGINNYFNSGASPEKNDSYLARFDHEISSTDRVFGRLVWIARRKTGFFFLGTPAEPDSFDTRRASRSAAVDYVKTLSPNWVLNLRAGVVRVIDEFDNISDGFDLASLGFSPLYRSQVKLSQFPGIAVSGMARLGEPGSGAGNFDTEQFIGTTTHIHGSHTLKAGGDFRVIRNGQASPGFAAGDFSFSSAFTQGPNPLQASSTAGFSFASYLLGAASGGSLADNTALSYQHLYFGSFVQDDIKLSRKLTVNLGVRFEREGGRTERYDRMTRGFAFDTANPLSAATGLDLRGGLRYAGVNGEPRAQVDASNHLAPRVGFAYSVTPTTVLRGGYGIFLASTTAFGSGPSAALGFSVSTPFVPSLDGVTPLNFLREPFPGGVLQPVGSSLGLATLVGQNISFVDPSRVFPYTQQYSLSLGRQFSGNLLVEATYAGNRGLHLPSGLQLNQLPDSQLSLGSGLLTQVSNPFFGLIASGPLASETVALGQLLRPFPQYAGVGLTSPMIGSSTYHSFQLKVERRFARGLAFLLSYTNSKLLDDIGAAQNNNNLRLERSLADIDRSQRLVVSGIWDLPFGRGRALAGPTSGFVNKLISGWQLNWVSEFQAGQPLAFVATPNTTNSLGGGQRPDSTGTSARLDHESKDSQINRYFDISAFTHPGAFRFGNLARSLPDVRGPGLANFDLSLFWNVSITERTRFQFRAEAFNAFNRLHLGLPGQTFGTPQFGVINDVASPSSPGRQIQLALRLLF